MDRVSIDDHVGIVQYVHNSTNRSNIAVHQMIVHMDIHKRYYHRKNGIEHTFGNALDVDNGPFCDMTSLTQFGMVLLAYYYYYLQCQQVNCL